MTVRQPEAFDLFQAVNLAYNPSLSARARLELASQAAWRERLPQACEKIELWHQAAHRWVQDARENIPRKWISIHCPAYPRGLLDLKDPPLILFAEGNIELLQTRSIGMVGSRNASTGGLNTARDFARVFANEGWCVISGLAEGIDGAAHGGALSCTGNTLAVLGGGVDQIYPRCHLELAEDLLQKGGLIVSEYPPGTAPQPAFFPRRNRIIAALSDGLLVVEAAVRSGSLITARVASELGRPVMAIPGSIHSPQSKGCHAMIKKGALLVETTQEVCAEVASTLHTEKINAKLSGVETKKKGTSTTVKKSSLNQELRCVLKELAFDPMNLDQLALKTGLSGEDLLAALTELELEGWAVSEPGNRWMRMR